jgi:hypothetical protein
VRGLDAALADERGAFERDFAFRGRSTANKLSDFRDHGPGPLAGQRVLSLN